MYFLIHDLAGKGWIMLELLNFHFFVKADGGRKVEGGLYNFYCWAQFLIAAKFFIKIKSSKVTRSLFSIYSVSKNSSPRQMLGVTTDT